MGYSTETTQYVTVSGQVFNCGDNANGKLGRVVGAGNPTRVNLGPIEELEGIFQADGGQASSYFLSSSGQVFSCGQNNVGQLGRIVTTSNQTVSNIGGIEELENIIQIVPNGSGRAVHFLTSTGQVYNCGLNDVGQLGRVVTNGSQTVSNLGKIEGLNDIIQIATGGRYYYYGTSGDATYLLSSSGQVYSCGSNANGQLGRAVEAGSATVNNLNRIDGLENIILVAVGQYMALALNSDGLVYSWGLNNAGQLGRAVASGTETTINIGRIEGLDGIVQVAINPYGSSSYFLDTTGRVYCCGANNSGQLGCVVANGSQTESNLGIIEGLESIVQIGCLSTSATFFLSSSGHVYSCGYNQYGELGRVVATGSQTVCNLGMIDFPELSAV